MYHLAHGRAQEERVTRLFATTEVLLIAVFTPVVGLLIDLYGSVDRVLVMIGQCFLLGLTLLALTSVLRSLKQPQRLRFTRSALRERPTLSWRPGYSLVRTGLAW
jgi:arginine exporter protein ArgO